MATKKKDTKKTSKVKKKLTPAQKRFKAAFNKAKSNGFKPFTKPFGAEMKKLLAK